MSMQKGVSRCSCLCLFGLAAAFAPRIATAAPTVWAIDDGEKIKQDATSLPFKSGRANPVWSPGQPIRLFALKNETVAFQVVVEADAAPLDGVTIDLASLDAPGGQSIANAAGATDPTSFVGRPIERFVEHYFSIARASGGTNPAEALGWSAGSGPAAGKWTGLVPDALIPVEVAPAWDPYPMHIDAQRNAVVWIDVTVPKTQAPGTYRGTVVVKAGSSALASLPIELQVIDATLPDRPVRTMLFYDRSELDRRTAAGDAVEKHLWQLYHRHRLVPMHNGKTAPDAERRLRALDGSIYTKELGYEGPAEGMGDGVLALGAYGDYGAPDATKLASVEQVANFLASKNVLKTTDVFVYAIDESCSSPYGKAWKDLLAGSTDANVKSVRVGWTCSEDPTTQPVDIPILLDNFDPAKTKAARAMGKEVWVYNGVRPRDGAFMTDTEAVGLRVNGWLSAMNDIGRWFYWETTFWYDDNRGGHGAYDPFATAETFHNASGDYAMGDGVLVYPGKQVDVFTEHSLGMNGVVASIRLKNWRRGIEDAGYLQLARSANAAKANAIAAALLPRVMSAAAAGTQPSWSDSGKPFFDARKALLDLIPVGANGGPGAGAPGATPDPGAPGAPGAGPAASDSGCGCRSGCGRASVPAGAGVSLLVFVGLLFRRRAK